MGLRWPMLFLTVLVVTGGIVALAQTLGGGADGTRPTCAITKAAEAREAGDVAGPVATATDQSAAGDYWTAERMRRASGAVQGEDEADGTRRPCD